jgi:hypothetical protein
MAVLSSGVPAPVVAGADDVAPGRAPVDAHAPAATAAADASARARILRSSMRGIMQRGRAAVHDRRVAPGFAPGYTLSMKRPSRTVVLRFASDGEPSADLLRGQLSAVVQVEGELWLASDESNSVERLTRTGPGEYGQHRTFRLADTLDLPAGEDSEIDIEGLDVDGGYLWLVGSHGLKRRKARPGKKASREIHRLAELRADGNRYLLARVPLVPEADGRMALAGRAEDARGKERTAARLMGGDRGNLLMDALRLDEHLAPFLAIPGKDNGLDIEGIAVRGERVFLGLRGPVLRGWAVVLELALVDAAPGLLRLALIDERGRPYRKHFLDLRGLGVRDLRLHGQDLLILAGPTMDLDGPAAVYRWRDALAADRSTLVGEDDVEEIISVPYGNGERDAHDHPEGLALLRADGGEPTSVLVVYDSPHARRKHGAYAVQADVFPLG